MTGIYHVGGPIWSTLMAVIPLFMVPQLLNHLVWAQGEQVNLHLSQKSPNPLLLGFTLVCLRMHRRLWPLCPAPGGIAKVVRGLRLLALMHVHIARWRMMRRHGRGNT